MLEASKVARPETPREFLAVIEDDQDVRLLIETTQGIPLQRRECGGDRRRGT
jgi:hypothetical protein